MGSMQSKMKSYGAVYTWRQKDQRCRSQKMVTLTHTVNEALRSIYTFCLHLYHSQIYTGFKPILCVKWSIIIGTMTRFDGDG